MSHPTYEFEFPDGQKLWDRESQTDSVDAREAVKYAAKVKGANLNFDDVVGDKRYMRVRLESNDSETLFKLSLHEGLKFKRF